MRVMVVGPGRIGIALAVALKAAGHDIIGAMSRHPNGPKAALFRELIQAPVYDLPKAGAVPGSRLQLSAPPRMAVPDVFLITVPDKAVTETAQTLSAAGYFDDVEVIVAHSAGSMSADALSPAHQAGVRRLCWHPLQTVADPREAPSCFEGVTFTMDGHPQAIAAATAWVTAIKGIPVTLDGKDRVRYHAAAVLASNALTALAATAASISGLENGIEALLPLLQGAIDNLNQFGVPQALTGPVERGDVDTAAAHLQALQDNPTAFDVYRVLGRATVEVAREKGTLTQEQVAAFTRLFSSGD